MKDCDILSMSYSWFNACLWIYHSLYSVVGSYMRLFTFRIHPLLARKPKIIQKSWSKRKCNHNSHVRHFIALYHLETFNWNHLKCIRLLYIAHTTISIVKIRRRETNLVNLFFHTCVMCLGYLYLSFDDGMRKRIHTRTLVFCMSQWIASVEAPSNLKRSNYMGSFSRTFKGMKKDIIFFRFVCLL